MNAFDTPKDHFCDQMAQGEPDEKTWKGRKMKDGAALDDVLGRLDANLPAALERLKDFVRIPSVGTDPAHDADTRRAIRRGANPGMEGAQIAWPVQAHAGE